MYYIIIICPQRCCWLSLRLLAMILSRRMWYSGSFLLGRIKSLSPFTGYMDLKQLQTCLPCSSSSQRISRQLMDLSLPSREEEGESQKECRRGEALWEQVGFILEQKVILGPGYLVDRCWMTSASSLPLDELRRLILLRVSSVRPSSLLEGLPFSFFQCECPLQASIVRYCLRTGGCLGREGSKLRARLMKDSSQGENPSACTFILFIIKQLLHPFPFPSNTSGMVHLGRSQLHETGQFAELGQLMHSGILVTTFLYLLVVAVLAAHVHLPWPTDAIGVLVHHLAPMRHPAHRTRHCEQHSEHVLGDADGLVDDARVEIHIRVQFSLDEVLVRQGLLLQIDCQVQQRLGLIVLNGLEDGVAHLLHDGGTRIEVFVHSVSEAHQAEIGVFILRPLDDLPDGGTLIQDLLQHVQHCLVGSAVVGPPERPDSRSNTGKGIGMGAAGDPDSGCGGILLVFCVADPDDLECPEDVLVDVEGLAHGVREHHVEEVLHVAEVLLRVDDRQAHGRAVGVCSQSGHLGYQLDGHLLAVSWVEQIVVGVQEGGQRAHNAHHDGHGVGFTPESLVELNHLLVYHHLSNDHLLELHQLTRRRQRAIQQEVTGLHIGGMLSQVLDAVSPVEQLSLLAVDVADIGDAAGSAHEARIVGEQIGLCEQGTHIDEIVAEGALEDRQFVLLVSHLQNSLLLLRLGLEWLDECQVQLVLHQQDIYQLQPSLPSSSNTKNGKKGRQ